MNFQYNLRDFFWNCVCSIFSNFTSLIVSLGFVFIIPKFIGVEAYGYWQLYLFYLSYIGLFHFGWIEGIYLKYGGSIFTDLNVNSFRAQFWFLNIFVFFLSISLYVFLLCFCKDAEQREMGCFIIVNLLLVLPKTFLAYILLALGRIQEHSTSVLAERFISVGCIVFFFLSGYRQYQVLILADIIGKLMALGLTTYFCWIFVWGKFSVVRQVWTEIGEHIAAGSKLMFANIAGMLMLGIFRFAIEQNWGVVVFGKVSMALSVANLFLIFVSAVNVVLFPLLRRTPLVDLPCIYEGLCSLLDSGTLGVLLLYYPIAILIEQWLPAYGESCLYLALLFPLCIYESKWTLLLYPYLKTLRKEKNMLLLNLISLGSSTILAGIAVFWLKHLIAAVFFITVLTAFRCFLAELFLARNLEIQRLYSSLWEVSYSIFFFYTSYMLSPVCGAVTYVSFYLVYLTARHRTLLRDWNIVARWICRS